MTRVNRLGGRLAACVLAATTGIAGCASTASDNSTTAPGGPPFGSTSAPDTSIPPTSVAATPSSVGATPSEISMSPPHIVCHPGTVAQIYDGSTSHPIELCLMRGALARLTINPPGGASWPKPMVQPTGIVSLDASTVDSGGGLHVTVTARSHGTATLLVPDLWQLQIAVA